MIFVWLAGGFLILMTAIHMARPYYEKRRLSQARFFADLSAVMQTDRRWRPGNPLRSFAFYLRLLFSLLLLLAFWMTFLDYGMIHGEMHQAIGLWLLMDTSASMSAVQNGRPRLGWAQLEVSLAVAQMSELSENSDICFRLSTFDLERRDLLPRVDATTAIASLPQLEIRPLGTDLRLIRAAVSEVIPSSEVNESSVNCPVTHLLVITDLPAPDWLAEVDFPIIWRDIAVSLDNVGFSDLYALRDPLSGTINQVYLEVTAFGTPPTTVQVKVEGPDGHLVMEEQITDWAGAQVWRGNFTPDQGGVYQMSLSPGGLYDYDDIAPLFIEEIAKPSVDWQLEDTTIPALLNWRIEPGSDFLRVVPYEMPLLGVGVPTLYVGDAYDHLINEPQYISDFEEGSPLLLDVNLDAVEQLGLRGISLPDGFIPVLRGENENTWLAQREDLPAAYIPGLPVFSDDNLGRFSTLVFLNAVQWLTQQQPRAALYTLTSPEEPYVGDGRLALHPGEGNIAVIPFSHGELTDVQPVRGQRTGQPIWPLFLLAMASVFTLERILSAYGGGRWR